MFYYDFILKKKQLLGNLLSSMCRKQIMSLYAVKGKSRLIKLLMYSSKNYHHLTFVKYIKLSIISNSKHLMNYRRNQSYILLFKTQNKISILKLLIYLRDASYILCLYYPNVYLVIWFIRFLFSAYPELQQTHWNGLTPEN